MDQFLSGVWINFRAAYALPKGGAFLDPRGNLWFVGELGRTARGTLESRLFPILESVASGGLLKFWLDGPDSTDDPFELFVVSDEATFDRFADDRWEPLANADLDPGDQVQGGVAWLGPGEAVAVGVVREGVLRHRRFPGGTSTTTVERLRDLGLLERPTAVVQVDGLGTVVSDQFGRFYVNAGSSPNEWALLAETNDRTRIQAMVPFRGGFLFVQSNREGLIERNIRQYHPKVGFCPPVEDVLDDSVSGLSPFPNGAVLIGVRRVGLARSTIGASSCTDGPDMTTWEPTPE